MLILNFYPFSHLRLVTNILWTSLDLCKSLKSTALRNVLILWWLLIIFCNSYGDQNFESLYERCLFVTLQNVKELMEFGENFTPRSGSRCISKMLTLTSRHITMTQEKRNATPLSLFFNDFFHFCWFTVFYHFLLYSKVTQSHICTRYFSHIFLHQAPS